MIRVLLWLTAGILTASSLQITTSIKGGIISLLTLFVLYILSWTFESRLLTGLFALFHLIIIGVLLPGLRDERLIQDHLIHQNINSAKALVVEVIEDTRRGSNFSRTMVEIVSVRNESKWRSVLGKCVVYGAPENAFLKKQKLLILGTPENIRSPWNPSDFDYKKWLEKQNIFFSHNLRPGNYFELSKPPVTRLNLVQKIDSYCKSIIIKNFKDPEEKSIVLAMVLGNTTEMTPELTEDFAATGTLHVLAVSGLHVSIICGILLILLRPVSFLKKGKWLLTAISLVVLWFYAVLTGLSPSVLRAVTMYSFLSIAKPFGLRTNVFNTLASSAFILLLFDPWMLERPGFQLSFLAVTGIVWVYPRLVTLYEPITHIGFYLWSTLAMTLSAQLLTFPLSLVLFGEFPMYFIPANLIIIPLSSLSLILGIVTMVVDPIPFIGQWIAIGISWSIRIMISVSEFFSDLPGSILPANFTAWEGVFLFLLTVCLILTITRKDTRWIYGSLIFALMGSVISIKTYFDESQKKSLCIFRVPGKSAVLLRNGLNSTMIFTDSAQGYNYFNRLGKKQWGTITVFDGNSTKTLAFKHGTQKILYLNQPQINHSNHHFNLVILGEKAEKIDLEKASIQFDSLILDSSIRGKTLKKVQEKFNKTGVSPFSVYESGAWCNGW